MIKKAQEIDIEIIKEMYAKLYSPQFVSFYFDNVFKPLNTYVIKDQGKIVSTLAVNRHGLWLKGKKINASYISALYTLPEYRNSALFDVLIKEVIEEMSYNDLITIVQSKSLESYAKYDFRSVFQQKNYLLSRAQIPLYPSTGIVNITNIDDLAQLYHQFTYYFDGYFHRDKDYYQLKLKWLNDCGYKLIGYTNQHGQLEGYLIYDPSCNPLVVKEIIYLNSIAFLKLLSYALNISENLIISLSNNENILKLVPTAIYNKKDYVSARLNDIELFNRLYNSNIKNINEAFALSGKPLFLNEDY